MFHCPTGIKFRSQFFSNQLNLTEMNRISLQSRYTWMKLKYFCNLHFVFQDTSSQVLLSDLCYKF